MAVPFAADASEVCFILARGPGDLDRIEKDCPPESLLNIMIQPPRLNSDLTSMVTAQFCDFSDKIEISAGHVEGSWHVRCSRARDTPRQR